MQDVAASAECWRAEIERGVTVLLADEGAELTGFVASGPARGPGSECGVWEIYNLHVSPSRKGQGIGNTLFDSAAQVARDHGAAELVLWVVTSNLPARRFYELKGMRHDGTEQAHPVGAGESLHEVRYRMNLVAPRLPCGATNGWS